MHDTLVPPVATKTCTAPGHQGPNPLPVTEFGRAADNRDKLKYRCRKCMAEATRRWQAANPDKKRGKDQRWQQANRDRLQRQRQQRYQVERDQALEAARRWRLENPEKAREHDRRPRSAQDLAVARERTRRWRLENPAKVGRSDRQARADVFAHYGQACACCGTTDGLSIDHINGDGSQHREQIGKSTGAAFYRWLIRSGFPGGFQTLCLPCNQSKQNSEACRLNHPPMPAALAVAKGKGRT
jgi:hypothetical protein